MRKQLIAITILTTLLVTTWVGKALFISRLRGDWAYLYWMTVSICALIVLVLCVNCLIEGRRIPETPTSQAGTMDESNRRNSFRVTYPENVRPTLLVEQIDDKAIRYLEFKVLDISEEGICFIEDGSLGKAKKATGHLLFNSGERIAVIFVIIRRHGYRISARLQNNLTWKTLIREQQRMLAPKRKV